MNFRFDFSTYFYLLPLDVHRIITLYCHIGVSRNFHLHSIEQVHGGALGIYRDNEGRMSRIMRGGFWSGYIDVAMKSNGNLLVLNDAYEFYEQELPSMRLRRLVNHDVHTFCLTKNDRWIASGHGHLFHDGKVTEIRNDIKSLASQRNGNLITASYSCDSLDVYAAPDYEHIHSMYSASPCLVAVDDVDQIVVVTLYCIGLYNSTYDLLNLYAAQIALCDSICIDNEGAFYIYRLWRDQILMFK